MFEMSNFKEITKGEKNTKVGLIIMLEVLSVEGTYQKSCLYF
jgi:hypothetical protein